MIQPTDFRELVDLNRQLQSKIRNHLRGWSSSVDSGVMWPLSYLGSHVLDNHFGLVLLAEQGMGLQAGTLLRSMFEATVTAVWMAQEPERVQRFHDYQIVATEKYRRLIRRYSNTGHFPLVDTVEYQEMDKDMSKRAREILRRYKLGPRDHWTGKSLKGIAREIGWSESYDFIYGTYSEILHASVAGAHEYVTPITGKGIHVGAKYNLFHADACLREGYFYLIAIFMMVNILIELDLDAILEDAWDNVQRVIPGVKPPHRPSAD